MIALKSDIGANVINFWDKDDIILDNLQPVGVCGNQIQIGFPWWSRFTNGLKYYLLFKISNLESGFAASLE